ncbi:hypothetical protein AAG570_012328 [Ranatra chinensis]|uniref:AAA+ ATPase domain-containing protein n=1 Tax=Ranatra chinensis TaxID=642074 RepID=A0ABD0YIR9_9HEMI
MGREYQALKKLFNRSGLTYTQQHSVLKRAYHTSGGNNQRKNDESDKDKKNEDNEKISSLIAKAFLWMLTAYMVVAAISIIVPNSNQHDVVVRYVSWNEFLYHMLAKGEVEEIIIRPDLEMVTIILHEGAVVKDKRMEHNTFHMNIVDIKKFEEKLREAEKRMGIAPGGGVSVVYERGSETAGKLLASIILASVIISLLSRTVSVRSSISMDRFSQLGRAKFTLVEPSAGHSKGIKFTDVAGLKEAKTEVMEIVDYLKRPDYYKNLGAKVPRGVLLLGPPGCGKTLLAKALATEAKVPFLSMNGSEFIEMIGGLGAARVRDLFKEGRNRAPCIVYIDEIDAIGKKRSGISAFGGSSGEGEQTLNQLLVEMDGIASKEGVLMLASTNRADVLDKALLRPGRFDRHILIDLPNLSERTEIFEHHLKTITLENPANTFSKRLAFLTPGFSGADIANVCNEAALHAARSLKRRVSKEDLEYAVERVVGGTEKRSHVMTPEEKQVVAYHESGHALVGWLLPHTDVLLKVTIVPRTNLALGFAQYTPSEQKLYSKEELFGKMCMALGGRAAEAISFNKITTGAQNDLQKVTDIAYRMVQLFGMNETVGLISFELFKDQGMRPYSKRMSSVIDHEARKLVSEAYKKTEKLLKDNYQKLELMSQELLKKETLNYNDVEKLLGPPLFGKKKLLDPAEFEMSLKNIASREDVEVNNNTNPDNNTE